MPEVAPPEGGDGRGPSLGWRILPGVLALYAACAAAATFPYALSFATKLPTPGDPSQHLWIMRWYKSCLLEGRLPFLCPEMQHPVGAPLAYFSPLHVQTLLYLPLSAMIHNDYLCYNIIWMIGLSTTGMGTFLLAWHVLRDRASAVVAGLLGMLSGPVLLHAFGHTELIYLGCFPAFLVAWLRFLDRPTRRRLVGAAMLYVLAAACAAYFVVLAAVPAALAVAWDASRAGWRGLGRWSRDRAAWLAGFAALTGPCLLVLFSSQLWAVAHGLPMARSRLEFENFGSPAWSYLIPTSPHRGARLLPPDVAEALGSRLSAVEEGSYLGVVTLLLIVYAAARRVRFPRAGFWWSALGLLFVLSLGAYWDVGSHRVALPALWAWRNVPVFRLLRSSARFNLLAAVLAAVPAAAGLRHLLARLGHRGARIAVCAGLAALAIADLGVAPPGSEIPAVPACYAMLKRRDPHATLLELPVQRSGSEVSPQDRTYWQSLHRLRTSAGYSGLRNPLYDHQVFVYNPFPAARPGLLADPDSETFGIVADVGFRDYAWLFLTAHRFDYVVLHHREEDPYRSDPTSLARIRAELRGAEIFEDDAATVYDRARLNPPARPVLVCTEGWRSRAFVKQAPRIFVVSKVGRIAVYSPGPQQELTLSLEAAALRRPRTVRVRAGDVELARWRIDPGAPREYTTPRFRLPAGLGGLTVESDGEERPVASRDAVDDAHRPYSLRVFALRLKPAAEAVAHKATDRGAAGMVR